MNVGWCSCLKMNKQDKYRHHHHPQSRDAGLALKRQDVNKPQHGIQRTSPPRDPEQHKITLSKLSWHHSAKYKDASWQEKHTWMKYYSNGAWIKWCTSAKCGANLQKVFTWYNHHKEPENTQTPINTPHAECGYDVIDYNYWCCVHHLHVAAEIY